MKKLIAFFLIGSVSTLGIARADTVTEDTLSVSAETLLVVQEIPPVSDANNAEEVTTSPTVSPEEAVVSPTLQQEEKSYAHVGKASNEAVKTAKHNRWRNTLIAVGAVIVAITALVLVHNNAGHATKH